MKKIVFLMSSTLMLLACSCRTPDIENERTQATGGNEQAEMTLNPETGSSNPVVRSNFSEVRLDIQEDVLNKLKDQKFTGTVNGIFRTGGGYIPYVDQYIVIQNKNNQLDMGALWVYVDGKLENLEKANITTNLYNTFEKQSKEWLNLDEKAPGPTAFDMPMLNYKEWQIQSGQPKLIKRIFIGAMSTESQATYGKILGSFLELNAAIR